MAKGWRVIRLFVKASRSSSPFATSNRCDVWWELRGLAESFLSSYSWVWFKLGVSYREIAGDESSSISLSPAVLKLGVRDLDGDARVKICGSLCLAWSNLGESVSVEVFSDNTASSLWPACVPLQQKSELLFTALWKVRLIFVLTLLLSLEDTPAQDGVAVGGLLKGVELTCLWTL